MEMGILKESTAIVIRQLSLLYYCGNGQRNSSIGISGGPQPSGSKKDLFLISELKQRIFVAGYGFVQRRQSKNRMGMADGVI